MMKRMLSGGGVLAIALLLGVVTAGAALAWLTRVGNEQSHRAAAVERSHPVVVAKVDIAAGTRLTTDVLEIRSVPEADILPGTAADTNAMVGKVLRYPLLTGEQVSARKIVADDPSTSSGLAFAVPDGLRAVSIPITEVHGAGGLIVPGDRVDVLVQTDYQRLFNPTDAHVIDDQDKRQPTVITLQQDLLVIAVGQQTTPADNGERDAATLRSEKANPQPAAKSVTLAVTPTQAQALFFAQQEGTIGLALRAFGDTNTANLGPFLRLEPANTSQNTSQ